MNRYGIAGTIPFPLRADLALTQPPFARSRREAKRLLSENRVVVNGRPLSIASRGLETGDHLTLVADDATIPILDQEPEWIVADKPSGIPTQPSPASDSVSLLEVLTSQLKRSGETRYEVYLVHRLDTNTTGVIVFGRTAEAAARLTRALTSKEAEKIYLALVCGSLESAVTIDAAIGRIGGSVFGTTPHGRHAVTHIEPLAGNQEATLVSARIETGRTHQIRVHLASIGHPVLGDRKYGLDEPDPDIARSMLHAARLTLGGRSWISPLPADLRAAASAKGLSLPAGLA